MARPRGKRQASVDWGILSESIGPRIRLLRNTLTAQSILLSAPFGLPTGSLTILSLIAANPGSSQIALARQAGINKSALVGIVDELERRGFAARDRSDMDRRRNTLRVTEAGKQQIDVLFATVTVQEAPVRDALGAEDMAKLIELLDRAISALDEAGAVDS